MKIQIQCFFCLLCLFGFCWFGSAVAEDGDSFVSSVLMPGEINDEAERMMNDEMPNISDDDLEPPVDDSEQESEGDVERESDNIISDEQEILDDSSDEDVQEINLEDIEVPRDEFPGVDVDFDEIIGEQPEDDFPGDEVDYPSESPEDLIPENLDEFPEHIDDLHKMVE